MINSGESYKKLLSGDKKYDARSQCICIYGVGTQRDQMIEECMQSLFFFLRIEIAIYFDYLTIIKFCFIENCYFIFTNIKLPCKSEI